MDPAATAVWSSLILMNIKDSNIAIVHDWFLQNSFGGSEKVTLTLNNFFKESYSNPDIFALTSNIEKLCSGDWHK